jgi:hypothetical protein
MPATRKKAEKEDHSSLLGVGSAGALGTVQGAPPRRMGGRIHEAPPLFLKGLAHCLLPCETSRIGFTTGEMIVKIGVRSFDTMNSPEKSTGFFLFS